jgi:hypothetical protein
MEDKIVRFEALKIAAQQKLPTTGIQELLINASTLVQFVTSGVLPPVETV